MNRPHRFRQLAVGAAPLAALSFSFAACSSSDPGSDAPGPDSGGVLGDEVGVDGGAGLDEGGGGDDGAAAGDGPKSYGNRPPGKSVTYTCTKEIHVAVTGDDGGDGSSGSPLRSIAKATSLAKAGDCVKVHAGTYAEATTIAFAEDGTAVAPIVLLSADGPGTAIIDGATNHAGPAVLVKNDHVIVDGFELKNTPLEPGIHVVRFDGNYAGKGVGSVLRNCKITGGFDQLKIYQATQGVLVENNEFYGPSAQVPISLTGASGLVFRANYCHDWDSGDNGAVQLAGGSKDAVFDGNLFQDVTSAAAALALGDGCGATCDNDPEHYAAVGALARNNLFVRVVRAFDLLGCKNCATLANTIVDSGVKNVVFKLGAATTNGNSRDTIGARILDNVVTSSYGTMERVIRIDGVAGLGLQMDYNLFWNGPAAVTFGPEHPAGADQNSKTDDPDFTSLTDLRPRAGSPAIGAGTNLVGEVPTDYLGAPRPASGAFDIGAIQH